MYSVARRAESTFSMLTTSTSASSGNGAVDEDDIHTRDWRRAHFSMFAPVGVAMTPPTERSRSVSRLSASRWGSSWVVITITCTPWLRASQTTRSAKLRKKGVGQVGYHQANSGGMADAEFAGGGAGPVPEFIDDPQHRFALGRRDGA